MTSVLDRRAQRVCLWAGPLMLVGFFLGAIVIGHFVPPFVHPDDSAREVAQKFTEHQDRTKLGAMIAMIALALLMPWGAAVAAQTRAREGRWPTLAYTQLGCAAISVTIVMLMCMFWALAAFRPGETDPDTTRALSDTAWFLIVWPYFPFSLWVAAVALAVFLDPSDSPVYPRWVAYYSMWNAISFLPAGFMPFFKHGPVSWAGLFALYIPLAMFFTWIITMTVYSLRNLDADGPR